MISTVSLHPDDRVEPFLLTRRYSSVISEFGVHHTNDSREPSRNGRSERGTSHINEAKPIGPDLKGNHVAAPTEVVRLGVDRNNTGQDQQNYDQPNYGVRNNQRRHLSRQFDHVSSLIHSSFDGSHQKNELSGSVRHGVLEGLLLIDESKPSSSTVFSQTVLLRICGRTLNKSVSHVSSEEPWRKDNTKAMINEGSLPSHG